MSSFAQCLALVFAGGLAGALAVACAGPAEGEARAPRAARVAPPPPKNPIPSAFQDGPGGAVASEGTCGNTEVGFDVWLESFGRHAAQQKISARTVAISLSGLTYDTEVIRLDRSQKAFKLSFEELAAKRLTEARVARGKKLLRTHAALLAKIEARFGVAPEILVAIWGLETDFGANVGSMSALRALATLAYDCRRAERFRGELLAALRIVERGDLGPDQLVGAWAGEIGQTQFLPTSYESFAIDFDGDHRADLIGSSADALASTAAYLQGHGWQAHEGFRLGSKNFVALGEWNASEVYRKVIVHFATILESSRRTGEKARRAKTG